MANFGGGLSMLWAVSDRRRPECLGFGPNLIKGVFGMAPPEGPEPFWRRHKSRLLCFQLKNGSSYKTFGTAPPKEPEPESRRSPTKQALAYIICYGLMSCVVLSSLSYDIFLPWAANF